LHKRSQASDARGNSTYASTTDPGKENSVVHGELGGADYFSRTNQVNAAIGGKQ
jgi:hypothetical protein